MLTRLPAVAMLLLLLPTAGVSARGRGHRPAWEAYSYPPSRNWTSVIPLRPSLQPLAPVSVPVAGPLSPAPVCAPVVFGPFCGPGSVLIPRGTPYAIPRPAPPSDTPVVPERLRPKPSRPPRVTESPYPSDEKSRPRNASRKSRRDRCRIGFWNVSNRDLTVQVNGRARRLARGRGMTLRLKRQFVWRIVGSTPHEESVPADKATMEIVIRR